MKAILRSLFLACILCSCFGVEHQEEMGSLDVPSSKPSASEQKLEVEVLWAEGFAFYENENERGIKLFAQEGASVFPLKTIARLKEGGTKAEKVLYLNEENSFAAQSTTQMAMFETIEALEHLKGVAYLDYVKSDAIHAAVQAGEMMDLSGSKEIDFEKLVLCNPDAVLVYPFGYDNEAQFEAADIPTIPISEYLESHPLGRLEWIKVFGFLCDEESRANNYFKEVESEYLSLIEKSPSTTPSVFTGSYSSGTWYAPGNDTFMAQFIRDAGGVYLFEDYPGKDNIQLPFETLFVKALDADFWGKVLYEAGDLSLDEIRSSDERFTKLKSFKEKQVFYCNAAEVDYFGLGVMEPHLILADLKAIFRKTDSAQFHYFKPVDR
jgi:iron complex transport system substrate-binding protein